ncbi:Uncharacterised protein [Bordetella pertussis]|nr:Uncharacterised protein [Bordetella pertussis]
MTQFSFFGSHCEADFDRWRVSNHSTSCSRVNNSSSPWLQPSRAR